jgi:hypothetical protein
VLDAFVRDKGDDEVEGVPQSSSMASMQRELVSGIAFEGAAAKLLMPTPPPPGRAHTPKRTHSASDLAMAANALDDNMSVASSEDDMDAMGEAQGQSPRTMFRHILLRVPFG